MSEKQEFKQPKTLGEAADKLYTLRQERYAAQKEVDAIKRHEAFLVEYLINTLPKSKAEGVTGKVARATIESKEVPQVKDWDALWKYIFKNKRTDMLQRRVSVEAVSGVWENGKEIPGVERFINKVVHLNKR